jgi:aspartyl-tRNA(Asn)/glutamyl-tRNA(Gln) amidotransferase subunit B
MTPDNTMKALLNSTEHRITEKDASTLLHIDDGERLDYYLDVLSHLEALPQTREVRDTPVKPKPQLAGNWYEISHKRTKLAIIY